MQKASSLLNYLTDEEILKEFVKRFQCDGAILIYMEDSTEYGFGRWRNSSGKKWVDNIFSEIKKQPKTNTLNEVVL